MNNQENSSSLEILIYQTLRAATDSNPDIVKRAESQLQEWQQQQGFLPLLAQVSLNLQVEINVRWIAAVFLKNSITQYWRRGTKKELQPTEKQQIRDILLKNIAVEPVPQVAMQLAVLIAQIARIDGSRDWPQLIPHLMDKLQGTITNKSANIEQYRVLIVMQHVIKAAASVRWGSEKKNFEELALNTFEFMHKMWQDLTQSFFSQLNQLSQDAITTLERALLCLRILRQLVTYGFEKPHKFDPCLQFIKQLFDCMQHCIKCRYELKENFSTAEELIALLEKFILKQMKTVYGFEHRHSKSFQRFIPTALEFTFNYAFYDGARYVFTNNIINFRNFIIYCLNLLKYIMSRTDNNPNINRSRSLQQEMLRKDAIAEGRLVKELQEEDENSKLEAKTALANFFTDERLSYICDKIISHYFLLTQMELNTWLEDPEGFGQDDSRESSEYALRPCVESLYKSFMMQYNSQTLMSALKFVRKAQATDLTENSSIKDILLKDAIYQSVGLSPFPFFHEIDFDSWFVGQLMHELSIKNDNFRILRRRIIWLVGEFASVKFDRSLRPKAYEVCLQLLDPQEDMAVRLTASSTLLALIRDYDFLPDDFLPYLEGEFNALYMLLRDAKECDTKMYVLSVMSALVDTMGDYMDDKADNLISYLPLLWKESEDYNMLRCSIITTLHQLVKAKRDTPESMRCFLYSVIDLSTNVQEPSHVYLLEEGLILWLAVVENSIVMNEQLLALCKNLLPIIEMSTENFSCVLSLIRAYLLLAGRVFLEQYGKSFIDFCGRMFENISPLGIQLMLKVFETCLKTEPSYSIELMQNVLSYIFKQVYINNETDQVIIMYLTIMARVLLIDANIFKNIILNLHVDNAFPQIFEVWITKLPLVTEVEKSKLFCLAVSSFFVSNPNIICEKFPRIMRNMADTLVKVMHTEHDEQQNEKTDNKESIDGNRVIDSMVFDDLEFGSEFGYMMDHFDCNTYHYDRLRQLSLMDPVHKIHLDKCLQWHLNAFRTHIGNEQYQSLMQTVPEISLQVLKKYINFD